MIVRIYAEPGHYDAEHRPALNDILKALWNTASLEERRKIYGVRPDVFVEVTSPREADVHLLPMKWPHYVENGRIDQAIRAVEVARAAGRPIAVFSAGDFEANFPVDGQDIHLFQSSAYRSRTRTRNHALPAFFEDPLPMFANGVVPVREKGPRPVIGFCGQAGGTAAHYAARYVRNQINRVRWRAGRMTWEPPPFEHTHFRQRVLDRLSDSSAVETKFVLRTRYRAGLSKSPKRNDPAEQSRREFVENVLGTDYTVCVRGAGNFSVRFYEALALGRIPLFVDTDCVLPYENAIDWRHHAVWIDESQLDVMPHLVAEFHASLSPQEFRERQLEGRKLWEERLSPDGFYRHFHEHFA